MLTFTTFNNKILDVFNIIVTDLITAPFSSDSQLVTLK